MQLSIDLVSVLLGFLLGYGTKYVVDNRTSRFVTITADKSSPAEKIRFSGSEKHSQGRVGETNEDNCVEVTGPEPERTPASPRLAKNTEVTYETEKLPRREERELIDEYSYLIGKKITDAKKMFEHKTGKNLVVMYVGTQFTRPTTTYNKNNVGVKIDIKSIILEVCNIGGVDARFFKK